VHKGYHIVMNYYERIQQSIDYIELHLADELSVDEAAKQAYMSVSNYYRMFYSITGYTVKEYIIYISIVY